MSSCDVSRQLRELKESAEEEFAKLRADMVRARMVTKTPREHRAEQRDRKIHAVATAASDSVVAHQAAAFLLIISGEYPAPKGQENNVASLRKNLEVPTSARHIARIIKEQNDKMTSGCDI